MFDRELYVETFSTLHASRDTLAEIQKMTSQRPGKRNLLPRPAFVLTVVLILMASSAVLAAGSRMMGGWVHHASLKDAEEMGFHYPQQLGGYRLLSDSPTRILVASEESSSIRAWLKPDYTWMSLEYENDAGQSLSICFGKTDDPLWAYCFGYNEKNGMWAGAENPDAFAATSADSSSYIENVTEYVYEGCTIYLADHITEYVPGSDAFAEDSDIEDGTIKPDIKTAPAGQKTEVEAHWVDSGSGLCFSISSNTDWRPEENSDISPDRQSMTQKEMLNYVKSLING